MQETLLRAWRHPAVLNDGQRTPRAWLFTVARNLVIDGHRARSARPAELPEEAAGIAASTDGGLDVALLRFELIDALSSLSAAHRDALVAVHYQGHTVTEAAAVLGVPEGTVKSRCYYAVRALRILLQERGLVP